MTVLISKESKILVQAITGKSGVLQTKLMLEAGSNIVAGVTPGKGGQTVSDVPVYNHVCEAKAEHDFDTVISFVPPLAAKDSSIEAIDSGIKLLVLTTEKIPLHDVMEIITYAHSKGTSLIGPGCAGIIAPDVCKVGSHPVRFFKKGRVGVVSKSGALSYEIGKTLCDAGIGQSRVIAIGGGPLWGLTQRDAVELYEKDADTEVIVLLGEIGGGLEESAAEYIASHVSKPVVAMIVGRNAPMGKSLGHAGAIINGSVGSAETKIAALQKAGAVVVKNPNELVFAVKKCLKGRVS